VSRVHIPAAVRRRVAEAARYRCGYCQTQQAVIGIPLHIEHIIPLAVGGSSIEDNLWLACLLCLQQLQRCPNSRFGPGHGPANSTIQSPC
jgi:5-methylcytosine-specific restriction endonuclease McrA